VHNIIIYNIRVHYGGVIVIFIVIIVEVVIVIVIIIPNQHGLRVVGTRIHLVD